MKTKVLLLAAAVMAVGAGTSMAQVYSANAVGYVNVSIPGPGFAIIANPLNNTNNSLNTILAAAPAGTVAYRFTNGVYQQASKLNPTTWLPNFIFNPGEGFFLKVAAPLNLTFVGEVPQGNLSNPLVGGNAFQLRASQVPQALPLGKTTGNTVPTLEFPALSGDVAYLFTAPSGPYQTFNNVAGNWLGTPGNHGPTIPVATGFFLKKAGPVNQSWNRNFTVN